MCKSIRGCMADYIKEYVDLRILINFENRKNGNARRLQWY